MAVPLNKIKSEKLTNKNSIGSESSPYSRSMHRLHTSSYKKNVENYSKCNLDTEVKIENCNFYTKLHSRHARIATYSETYAYLEKAKYFSLKLAHLISNKPMKFSNFEVYSRMLNEFADCFPEFKDFLLSLRKGLVLSAIKEKDFENFEFKTDIDNSQVDLKSLFNKERQDKFKIITKLNSLTDEHNRLKEEHETLKKKVEGYEKALLHNPVKYIEAENLVEKMLKQCEIISKQKVIINELKSSELKLKKIFEQLEMYGVNIENFTYNRENTILNPKCIKAYNRSKTLINAQDS
ncbi:hypothetical protein SteCoe_24133 [Stentor coeruleus]|uniref:Uncharacterized protein n=1 Tax=Stentor coeruleus TaxID=5963 RepID=A0A1R2BIB1_9CILI|nr:hypothetical protein SteCoe_24133 [Stentor coeruleus]